MFQRPFNDKKVQTVIAMRV